MLKKIMMGMVAAVYVAGAFALGGCNTVAGAGADIERGGAAIKNEAREQQQKR